MKEPTNKELKKIERGEELERFESPELNAIDKIRELCGVENG